MSFQHESTIPETTACISDYMEEKETDGAPWVTCFLLEKKEFAPNLENAMVIFCKSYETEGNALEYAGHLIVDKDIRCLELFSKIADLLNIEEGREFGVFVEIGQYSIAQANPFSSCEEVDLAESGFDDRFCRTN